MKADGGRDAVPPLPQGCVVGLAGVLLAWGGCAALDRSDFFMTFFVAGAVLVIIGLLRWMDRD